MRLFTSSSSDRVPHDPRGLSAVVAVILFLIGICGVEVFWRHLGHHPSVADDPAWWAHHRAVASNLDTKTIALLGTSRIQLGFSTEVFRDRYPEWKIAHLAVNGRRPIPALLDLSEDEKFRGIVICDARANTFDSSSGADQQEYVDYFHREFSASLNGQVNRVIGSHFQSMFVSINPWVRLGRVIKELIRHNALPEPNYLVTNFDRSRAADYTLIDVAEHRQSRIDRVRQGIASRRRPKPEEWLDNLEKIKNAVSKIKSRGGDVVFVRFPTTGEHWQLDEQAWPRRIYWDQIGKHTGAHTVHFQDIAALADLDCPDTSHIDQRDKASFTSALLDELVRLGTL